MKLRTREVFIPGGQPQHTYVSRDEHRLEEDIRASTDNLCKLVTVTGPTKSGKSVLVKRVFSGMHVVWVDGGSVGSEQDLWAQVAEQLAASTTLSKTDESASTGTVAAEAGADLGIPGIGKAGVKANVGGSRSSRTATTTTRETTTRAAAVAALQRSRRPLIVDDFHYLEEDIQATFVRAVKALVFDGHPTLILAIPHRRYDAVRVEREMTGRVQQVAIPTWTTEELRRIPDTGLPLLNAVADDGLIELFSAEALGSPHLVQEFFRELCIRAAIHETSAAEIHIKPPPTATDLLSDIAGHLSRPVFDALARGPRQRTDRMQRHFRDGRTGDVYVAVLNAIARLKPGMGALDYEQIRSSLRDLLVDLPQANEVSRVLEHMGTIQADQDASAPVLDWDKQHKRLHITDPYFAFFLKWGADVFANGAHVTSPASPSQPRAKGAERSTQKDSRPAPADIPKIGPVPARTRTPTGGPRPLQSDDPTCSLNANERTILECLEESGAGLTLGTIASKAFPNLPPEKANSWVRNSVRKPLRLGLIRHVAAGTYEAVRGATGGPPERQ